MTAIINIENSAIFSLILEGLEAYAIKHASQKVVALETHAQLWGKVNQTLPFKCNIKHVSVDSSALKKRDSVRPNPLSLTLKKDVAAIFGADFQHLGSFHTHPWLLNESVGTGKIEGASSIRKERLWEFSRGDYNCEINNYTVEVKSKKFSVALVMTILAAGKANDIKDGLVDNHVYEFSLGNLKLWLNAQVYEHKPITKITSTDSQLLDDIGMNDLSLDSIELLPVPIPTALNSEFLQEFKYICEKFGRLKIEQNSSEYREAAKADKRWFA